MHLSLSIYIYIYIHTHIFASASACSSSTINTDLTIHVTISCTDHVTYYYVPIMSLLVIPNHVLSCHY